MHRLPPRSDVEQVSETALGDWYVNRIVVDRRPLLLLASMRSLFTILEPARSVRALPDRLGNLVKDRLQRLHLPPELIDPEIHAMRQVLIRPTKDRSVLGSMNDIYRCVSHGLEPGVWNEDHLPFCEAEMWEMPCRVSGAPLSGIFPGKETVRLLSER